METPDGVVVADDMSFEMAFNEDPTQVVETPEPAVVEPEPAVAEPEPVAKVAAPVVVDESRYQRLEAEIAELKKPKVEVAPVVEAKVLSDEEENFLNEFKEEFPDAVKALSIQRKAIDAEIDKRVQTAIASAVAQMNTSLAPMINSANESAHERFVREITTVHPDAQQTLQEVEQWITKLPTGLRAAYDSILDKGTSADVVELFTMYKAATGKTTQSPAPVAAPKVDQEKEAKLRKMEGVRTERTGVSADPDPYDFESAFAQATKR